MEALSPTMEEGRLVAWKKKEGDPVTSGDTLAGSGAGSARRGMPPPRGRGTAKPSITLMTLREGVSRAMTRLAKNTLPCAAAETKRLRE